MSRTLRDVNRGLLEDELKGGLVYVVCAHSYRGGPKEAQSLDGRSPGKADEPIGLEDAARNASPGSSIEPWSTGQAPRHRPADDRPSLLTPIDHDDLGRARRSLCGNAVRPDGDRPMRPDISP